MNERPEDFDVLHRWAALEGKSPAMSEALLLNRENESKSSVRSTHKINVLFPIAHALQLAIEAIRLFRSH
jgi:hypothetical protein